MLYSLAFKVLVFSWALEESITMVVRLFNMLGTMMSGVPQREVLEKNRITTLRIMGVSSLWTLFFLSFHVPMGS